MPAHHQLPDAIVTARREPQQMSGAISLEETGKEIRHAFSQIPTVERSAVDHRQPIPDPQLTATARPFVRAKLEQRKIHAARDYFMMYRSTAQPVPLSDDGPDSLGQRYDTVCRRQDA